MEVGFAKMRRKLADFVLGRQTVLFTSQRNLDLIEAGRYLELPDDALAAVTRRWFLAIERAHHGAAAKVARPVSAMTAHHAVLSLAKYARDANATTAQFIVRGSVDGGQSERVFSLTYEVLPDDYAFGAPGVEKVFDQADPEKLVKVDITFDNPGYAEWAVKRAAERLASPTISTTKHAGDGHE